MKIKHTIPLTRNNPDSDIHPVYSGESVDPAFFLKVHKDIQKSCVHLATWRDVYDIHFDKILNLYAGKANGLKVQITLDHASGKLDYWT